MTHSIVPVPECSIAPARRCSRRHTFCRSHSFAAMLMPLVVFVVPHADAKAQVGTVRLGGPKSEDRWRYIDKFGFAIGEGTYSMRLRLRVIDEQNLSVSQNESTTSAGTESKRRPPPSLSVDVFLDKDWRKVEALEPCRRAEDGPASVTHDAELNEKIGEWGVRHRGILKQVTRPHIWYFALSDCSSNGLDSRAVEIDYEFHAQQFDGSEFSFEARYMLGAESIAIVGLTALLFRASRRCEEYRQNVGALHPVILALAMAVALQYVSQVTHLIHMLVYRSDGEGLWLADVSAEVLFMVSQVLHATLLIAIAQGYTLLHEKSCRTELGKLAFVATLSAHAALVCFGKLSEGSSSHRHHENDGSVGWLILLVRLVLCVWFNIAVRTTQECGGLQLKEFLRYFQVAGSLYFLAYPTVFVIAKVFAPYVRHPIMQVGLLAMQACADLWLTDLFLSRGAYHKVSTLSSSFLRDVLAEAAWSASTRVIERTSTSTVSMPIKNLISMTMIISIHRSPVWGRS